jgi:hypothetical protein
VLKTVSTPTDPKVVKALELIESGADTIRGAVRSTGANRSTVRHHLRARGWSSDLPKKAKPKKAKSKAKAKPKKAKSKPKKSTAKATKKAGIETHLIVNGDGQRTLTVFIPGATPVIVTGDHPKFEDILTEAQSAAPNVERLRELADTTVLVSTRFEALTDRITTRNGRLYFDGDELDTALTQKILAMLDEDNDDWSAFVNFMDKLYLNPNPNARDAFYGWLSARPFGLTPEGDVIGYKGVEAYVPPEDGADPFEGASYQSWHNGPAIVNGEEYDGSGNGVPQSVGDVVEKPRSEVDASTRDECSDGLHVGTYSFANGRYGSTTLRVIVNPRDVVGVPTGVSGSEKFRCCRYRIDSTVTARDNEGITTNN